MRITLPYGGQSEPDSNVEAPSETGLKRMWNSKRVPSKAKQSFQGITTAMKRACLHITHPVREAWHQTALHRLIQKRKTFIPTPAQIQYEESRLGYKPMSDKAKPIATSPGAAWGHTNSPLFKLPRELRDMIWDMAFNECEEIHVFTLNYQLRAMPCVVPDLRDNIRTCICGGPWKGEPRIECYFRKSRGDAPHWLEGIELGIMGMMMTCRAMYEEVAEMIYRRKTFLFEYPETFLLFAISLPNHQLQRLRYLHFRCLKDAFHSWTVRWDRPLVNMPEELRAAYEQAFDPSHPLTSVIFRRYTREINNARAWDAMCASLPKLRGLKHVQMEMWANSFRGLLPDFLHNLPHGRRSIIKSERKIIEPLAGAAWELGNKVKFDIGTDWITQNDDPDWTGGAFDIERLWGVAFIEHLCAPDCKRLLTFFSLREKCTTVCLSAITVATCGPANVCHAAALKEGRYCRCCCSR